MKLNDKEYSLKFTGMSLVLYKQEFHKDLFATMAKMDNGIENVDIVTILELLWTLIKSDRVNDCPSFMDFCDSITSISEVISAETLKEIIEAIQNSATRTIELKKK